MSEVKEEGLTLVKARGNEAVNQDTSGMVREAGAEAVDVT